MAHPTNNARQIEALVLAHLPMVRRLANRYWRPGLDLDDLMQIGAIGLIGAAKTFSPRRNTVFSTHAFIRITGAIRHYIRDHGEPVRIPRQARALSARIAEATATMQQQLGRTPTRVEVAVQAGLPLGALEEVLAVPNGQMGSIDDPDMSPQLAHARLVGSDESTSLSDLDTPIIVRSAVVALPAAQRRVLDSIFYQGLSQSETARRLRIPARDVRKLMLAAKARLASVFRDLVAAS